MSRRDHVGAIAWPRVIGALRRRSWISDLSSNRFRRRLIQGPPELASVAFDQKVIDPRHFAPVQVRNAFDFPKFTFRLGMGFHHNCTTHQPRKRKPVFIAQLKKFRYPL